MRVIKYSHPDWAMDLYLNAEDPESVDHHLEVIREMNEDKGLDESLLKSVETFMNREDFDTLPEWDG